MDVYCETIKKGTIAGNAAAVAAAAAGAVILALSFPPYNMGGLAFVGFVPIFWAVFESDRSTAVVSAVISGVVFYCFLFTWLQRFHSLSAAAAAGVGILFFTLPLLIGRFLVASDRRLGYIAVPSVWVLFEYLKMKDLLKFGFGIIGYSQHRFTSFIQISDICGVWGCSFLILLSNYAVYRIIMSVLPHGRRAGRGEIALLCSVAIIVISVLGYGRWSMNEKRIRTADFSVQLSQFNHGANRDWRKYRAQYLDEYENMVSAGLSLGADLVAFPENAVKRWISLDPKDTDAESIEIMNRMSSIAAKSGKSVLFGSLEYSPSDGKKYNSAFLFNPEGNLSGRYRKHLLAPFGETDPFGGRFPAAERLLEKDTDIIRLDRGSGREINSVTGRDGNMRRFGTLICFEGTDGRFVSGYGRAGVDFLVNMTSDAWSESSGALGQHAAFAVFRAVENRKMLYRVGNGGITCAIDPFGRVVSSLPEFTDGILVTKLVECGTPEGGTVYSRFGDWFVIFCTAAFTAVLLIIIWGKVGKSLKTEEV